jgi:hypothetical protein
MKVKSLLVITLIIGLVMFGIRPACAQDFPKSIAILHTNNINGEIDPCPS